MEGEQKSVIRFPLSNTTVSSQSAEYAVLPQRLVTAYIQRHSKLDEFERLAQKRLEDSVRLLKQLKKQIDSNKRAEEQNLELRKQVDDLQKQYDAVQQMTQSKLKEAALKKQQQQQQQQLQQQQIQQQKDAEQKEKQKLESIKPPTPVDPITQQISLPQIQAPAPAAPQIQAPTAPQVQASAIPSFSFKLNTNAKTNEENPFAQKMPLPVSNNVQTQNTGFLTNAKPTGFGEQINNKALGQFMQGASDDPFDSIFK
ncbi:Hypothetical_protein [Hexamita inflata]|uniref:Hypothetical_protein n=1 Tax=Hexamita inflata TaxID=28002 RepID=A0AA86V1F8_9EUKA|nr:Hypothetical protein HINF_LOCUS60271 [Hexamita inflata]